MSSSSASAASSMKQFPNSAGDGKPVSKLGKMSALPRPSTSSTSGRATPVRTMSRETLSMHTARSSNDNWVVGDRCYINGTRPGKVAYLGEIRLLTGEWAGVVLDEPTGKNDGTYKGTRYFQCPDKHGVFCKINKLERWPTNASGAIPSSGAASNSAVQMPVNTSENIGASSEYSQDTLNISAVTASSASSAFAGEGSGEGPLSPKSVSSFGADTTRPSSPGAGDGEPSLKVGDRVVVSGNKSGVLRYLGTTAFKEGILWAGVELDQPLGKNDGMVEGKRYFACKPRFGLFAPAAKVLRAGAPSAPMLPSMNASYAGLTNSRASLATSVASKKLPPAPRQTLTSRMRIERASQSRMGSQESLNSLSSFHSAASVSRRKAMGTDRAGSIGPNSAAAVSSPIYATLQESLKEKEQHIEQLLRERDIERSEMARTAQMAEKAQQDLSDAKAEADGRIAESSLKFQHLQDTLEQSEKECKRFRELFEEERRKCEDLQFRVEEETIVRTELEEENKRHRNENESLSMGQKDAADEAMQRVLAEKEQACAELVIMRSKLSEMESRNGEMEKTMAAWVQEKRVLQEQLEEHQSQWKDEKEQMDGRIAEMQKHVQVAQEKINTLSESVKSKDQSIEELEYAKGCLETEQSKMNSLQEENKRLRDENESLSMAQRDAADEAMQRVLAEKEQAFTELASMRSKLSEMESRNGEMEKTMAAWVQEKRVLQEQLEGHQSQWKDKKEQMDGRIAEMQKHVQVAQEKMNTLTESVKSKDQAIKEMEYAKGCLETELGKMSNLQEENTRLRNENESLSMVQRDAADEAMQRVLAEKQQACAELASMRSKLSEMESRNGEMEKTMAAWVQEKRLLQEQLEGHQSQWDNEKEVMDGRIAEMQKHVQVAQEKINTLTESVKSKDQSIEELEYAKGCLETELGKMNSLQEENTRLRNENESLSMAQRDAADEAMQRVLAEKEQAFTKSESMRSKLSEMEKTMAALMQEKRVLQEQLDGHQSQWKDEKEQMDGRIAEMQKHVQVAQEKINTFSESAKSKDQTIEEMEYAKGCLETELSKVKRESVAVLEKKIEDERQRDATIKELQEKIEELSSKLIGESEFRKVLQDNAHEEVAAASNREIKMKASLEQLEHENFELSEKLSQAEIRIAELAKLAVKSSPEGNTDTGAAGDRTESHINFLNSIIADKQKEIDELHIKVEILVHGGIEGLGVSNGLPRVHAPRKYCDICETFDEHETEECPTQESVAVEDESHSHFHGARGEQRPYCDNCEMFGHSTEECVNEDNQTF